MAHDLEVSSPQRGWRLAVKSAFDRATAATLLVLLSPVLGAAALAIRVTMGGPIFFSQRRPGRGERPFRLVKFRTMTPELTRDGRPLSLEERVTPVGRLLRATSVDELPQLWNVLRGELSLVGPRPLLPEYLPHYTAPQRRRHAVMPGVTGWAQVNGRQALGWEKKLELDGWYVDNWSLALDLAILARTALCLVSGKGVTGSYSPELPPSLRSVAPGSLGNDEPVRSTPSR